jgi:hypothetical protein
LALNEDDDDKQPSRRPHIPNWICVKEECQDGGLTDLTTTLQILTPEKNAETIDLHTLPTLPTQSLRDAKISDEMTRDCIEETVVLDESESKVCKARLTPTSEPTDDGCKVSKVCKADDSANSQPVKDANPAATPSNPVKPRSSERVSPPAEKRSPREFKVGDKVVVAGPAGIYKGASGEVVNVYWSREGQECLVQFDKAVRRILRTEISARDLMKLPAKN